MFHFLRDIKRNLTISAILYIVFGIILACFPQITGLTICYFLGIIILLSGIISLISYFGNDVLHLLYRSQLVFSLFAICIGVFVLVNPQVVLTIIPVVVGLFIFIDSIMNLQQSFDLKRMGYTRWWISLLLSIVGCAFGLLVLFQAFSSLSFFFRLVGVIFIYEGICDIITIFTVSKQVKQLGEDFKEIFF